jgi:hypothetical protein
MNNLPPSLLTDPRYRNSAFASDPYLGRRPRSFRPGVQAMPDISTIADAVAAQQLQRQQAPATPAAGPGAQIPAPVDVNNPAAVAYLAQQAQMTAQNTKLFNREIVPLLSSALLPDEVNANKNAALNQRISEATGGPSVRTLDMLAAPAVRSTGPGGRMSLSQNPASLMAAASGLTPQAAAQARTMQLANSFAESQVDKPRAMSVTFADGTTEEGTLFNGNYTPRKIEKPTAPLPRSPIGDLQADYARAVAEDRFGDAEQIKTQIDNQLNPTGKPLTVMEFNFSPELSKQYKRDYGLYRADFARQVQGMQAPAPAPAPAPKPAAPAIPTYSMPAQPDASAPPQVRDRASYDAIPSGTRYMGTDGRIYLKK